MPRPSNSETGALSRLLEEWCDRRDPPRSWTDLAEVMNVSTSLVSQWRHRQVTLSLSTLQQLSETLDLDLGRLIAAAQEDLPAAKAFVLARSTGRKPGLASDT